MRRKQIAAIVCMVMLAVFAAPDRGAVYAEEEAALSSEEGPVSAETAEAEEESEAGLPEEICEPDDKEAETETAETEPESDAEQEPEEETLPENAEPFAEEPETDAAPEESDAPEAADEDTAVPAEDSSEAETGGAAEEEIPEAAEETADIPAEEAAVSEPEESVFSEGYITLPGGTAVWKDESCTEPAGTLESDAEVYASVVSADTPDILHVLFAVDGEVQEGFVTESSPEGADMPDTADAEKDGILLANCDFVSEGTNAEETEEGAAGSEETGRVPVSVVWKDEDSSVMVAPDTEETELGLPEQLTVLYSDETEEKIPVAWTCPEGYCKDQTGVYVFLAQADLPDTVELPEINVILFGVSAQAETAEEGSTEQKCGENAFWQLEDGVLTISGSGSMTDYNYDSVPPWYEDRESITSAVVEDGITHLGKYAFYICSEMKSVSLPDSLETMGAAPFFECTSLSSVKIPSKVEKLSESAFNQCQKLKSVSLPDGLTELGKMAFQQCESLTSVTIPEGVKEIPEAAFDGCRKLSSVTLSSKTTFIGNSAFLGCTSLEKIGLPDGLETISAQAFKECTSLTGITVPNSVSEIEDGAFSLCSGLTSVSLPFAGKNRNADSTCGLFCRIFGECHVSSESRACQTVGEKGHWYYYPPKLTEVRITDAASIGEGAFSGCTLLKKLTVSSAVSSVGENAFDGCTASLSCRDDALCQYALSESMNVELLDKRENPIEAPDVEFDASEEDRTVSISVSCAGGTDLSFTDTEHLTFDAGAMTMQIAGGFAGEETVTVFAAGNGLYQPSSLTFRVTVNPVSNTIEAQDIILKASLDAQSFTVDASCLGGAPMTYTVVSGSGIEPGESGAQFSAAAGYAEESVIEIRAQACGMYSETAKQITVTFEKIANTITASVKERVYSSKAQSFSLNAGCLGGAALSYSVSGKGMKASSAGKVTVDAGFIGQAKIIIRSAETPVFKAASRTLTVKVNPSGTAFVTAVNTSGRKLSLTWKKNSKITAYQLQYSTDKSFKTGVKTKTVKGYKNTSLSVSGLTKGKTYYLRIRTYKTVSSVNYVSAWSALKKVKIVK